jgi:hypothetical protein
MAGRTGFAGLVPNSSGLIPTLVHPALRAEAQAFGQDVASTTNNACVPSNTRRISSKENEINKQLKRQSSIPNLKGVLILNERVITANCNGYAVWCFANLARKIDPEHESWLNDVIKKALVTNCNATGLSQVAWSFGKLKLRNPAFLKTLADLAHSRISEFNQSDMSMLLWGFANLNYKNLAFLDIIASSLLKLRLTDPPSLAMISWSSAKLDLHRKHGAALFSKLATECETHLCEFKPQGYFLILFSYPIT